MAKNRKLHALPRAKKTYSKKPHDCKHDGRKFELQGTVQPAIAFNKDIGPEDPDRQVVGHALVIGLVKCDECGQPFRFLNLPTKGNLLQGPLMSRQNLQLTTPVEPDTKIIAPDGVGILLPTA
jgi:hypothetical protein